MYAEVTHAMVEDACRVVSAHLPPTPLVTVELPGIVGPVHLKLETLQPTGSFKVRGALAALDAYAAGPGVVTASAGNHGLGIAYAATLLDRRATIFVPRTAAETKIAALRARAADLRLVGDSYDEAERAAIAFAEREGARFVSAYADPYVIAGQASLLREVAEVMPGAFQIVLPVGGGGLCSGVAIAASRTNGRIRVVGVEAASSPAVSSAMRAGQVVEIEVAPTLADGLAGNLEPAARTPQILLRHGVEMVAVSEAQIVAAIATLAFEHGIVAEGSAAVGIAALAAGLIQVDGPIVVVVTGRNISTGQLIQVLGTRT